LRTNYLFNFSQKSLPRRRYVNNFGFSVPIGNNFGSTSLSVTYAKFYKLF